VLSIPAGGVKSSHFTLVESILWLDECPYVLRDFFWVNLSQYVKFDCL
jgi:hypothetical protein